MGIKMLVWKSTTGVIPIAAGNKSTVIKNVKKQLVMGMMKSSRFDGETSSIKAELNARSNERASIQKKSIEWWFLGNHVPKNEKANKLRPNAVRNKARLPSKLLVVFV